MPTGVRGVQGSQLNTWIFGYGSLIWRPGFDYLETQPAKLCGYERRFWQGSHDHRGVPEQPGRVVTLVPQADSACTGRAFLLQPDVVSEVFEQLDYREKNGYERIETELHLADGRQVNGRVYIAPIDNFAYLGAAPLTAMAEQIVHSVGPSGRNIDYLLDLAEALRQLGADDPHVFELELAAKAILERE